MDLREVFATNLRRLRHAKGISQDELAYEAKVSRSYLSQIEKGVYYASLKIVGKVAKTLDVEPAELLKLPPKRRKQGRELGPWREAGVGATQFCPSQLTGCRKTIADSDAADYQPYWRELRRQRMAEIDAFSLTTVPIQQFANGQPMKSATGFVWKEGEQHYLVTNWHVVTGKNAATGKLETHARSDMLRALFNVRVGDFGKQQYDITIRDENHDPLWLIYPGQGRAVDVVVIPLPMTGTEPVMDMYPINALLSRAWTH
jgi:transcriptional regulator with XRE-family HTH domain